MTSPEANPQGLEVLLVDDSHLQLAQMRAHLAARGHHVVTARNGAEALILLQNEHPDLVISDCVMPLLDGYQLCRLIKDDRSTRHIPVVLLTSMGNNLSAFWARICGADSFLHKHPDLEALVTEALALMEGRPPNRTPRKPRPVNPETLGVDAIQRRLSAALEHRLLETSLRDAISKLYTMTGDTPDLVNGFLALIQELVLPGAALVMFHDDQALLAKGIRGRAVNIAEGRELERATLQALGAPLEPPCQWTLAGRDDQPMNLREPVRLSLPLTLPHITPYGCMTLLVERRTAGEFERLFEVAAQELARLLSLEEARLKLYHLAVEDPLTGLANRRKITELLEREVDLVARFKKPFTVLMVDVDHFKNVNDHHGHQAGDRVLQEVTRRILDQLRRTDTLGRWGGDEFLVICTQTDHGAAQILAQRLREAVRQGTFGGLGGPETLSLSIGVATWRGTADTPDDLLRRADQRLYRAKGLGRDQVVSEPDVL